MKIGSRIVYLAFGGSCAALCCACALLALSIASSGCAAADDVAGRTEDVAVRGEYLVTVLGCDDCHTPKKMVNGIPTLDVARRVAGHPEGAPHPTWQPQDIGERHALFLGDPNMTAWAGPWGVSFSPNITPDTDTGLGEWTKEAFAQAIRTGKHQGQPNGRPILPPMPWQGYSHLTDDDLNAMWEYLRSLPPVKNAVPTPVPPPGPPPGE